MLLRCVFPLSWPPIRRCCVMCRLYVFPRILCSFCARRQHSLSGNQTLLKSFRQASHFAMFVFGIFRWLLWSVFDRRRFCWPVVGFRHLASLGWPRCARTIVANCRSNWSFSWRHWSVDNCWTLHIPGVTCRTSLISVQLNSHRQELSINNPQSMCGLFGRTQIGKKLQPLGQCNSRGDLNPVEFFNSWTNHVYEPMNTWIMSCYCNTGVLHPHDPFHPH